MVDDTSLTWKWYAQKRLRKSSLFIPIDMGMEFVRNMDFGEFVDIVRKSIGGRRLTDELRSFLDVDLVVVASNNGEAKYLVVEIAFNARQIHSRRAVRFARLLEEHSAVSTIPVVASYHVTHEVQQEINSGQVYWHYVPDHVLDSRDVEKENSISKLTSSGE